MFYEKSLLTASFAFVSTAFLRELEEVTVAPPKWICSLVVPAVKSKFGQYLILGVLDPKTLAGMKLDDDDNQLLIKAESKNKVIWRCISIIISCISFISVFIFYNYLILSSIF